MPKPLLRIWHFFTGHPLSQVFATEPVRDGTKWREQALCERCGKSGKRL